MAWRVIVLMGNYEEIKHHANIIRSIENLYDKVQSAVMFNDSTTECFRTTVGVQHGCLLSQTLFNIFLERIMCQVLDGQEDSVSIVGRLITDLRFANDIVVNAKDEDESNVLVDRLNTTSTRYKMKIDPDKIRTWWQTTQMASKERLR